MCGKYVLMEELTWYEYAERVKKDVILLPVGSTEQHGPHLPLGTDAIQIMHFSKLAAERIGGIVAPVLSYGYKSQPKSGGGPNFPGTTCLGAEALIFAVRDILKELIRHGANKIWIMDGHYENAMFLSEAIDMALDETRAKDVKILKNCFIEFLNEDDISTVFPKGFPGWDLEHAAILETSLMLYFRPDLVRLDRVVADKAENLPPYDIYPAPKDIIPSSGILADPTDASAEKGEYIVRRCLEEFEKYIRKEFD
ncbi:MAG: creatininase [Deltaproteobacteria bacterium]|nr:creatininase [Deltaproteobacteria bacterium]MBW2338733.1 creatininase [Deltaproteobacteria bacterium]